ncbi:MAG: PKD domain-containing protein, partial [Marinoscillum sp.]
MKVARQFILMLLLILSLSTFGQGTKLYVKNTELTVSGSGLLFVSGDYEDATESSETVKTLLNGGTLSVGGNIINSGNTIMINNVEVNKNEIGEIIISGGGNKTITSTESIFFPNLTVSNNTIVTFPQSAVTVDSILDISDGAIILNGDTIIIRDGGSLVGESTNNLTGEGGVRFEEFTINSGVVSNNVNGTGLGVNTSSSGEMITLDRYQGTSYTSVANGQTIERIFKLEFSGVSNITLEDVKFNYSDIDLNGLLESNLAIYASSDNKSSWIKLGGTLSAPNNWVHLSSVTFEQSKNYYLVLADKTCDSPPDAEADIIAGGGSFNGNTIEVCIGDELALTSNEYYYEWRRDSDGVVVKTNEPLTFQFEDNSEDLSSYVLYERKQNGCENSRTYPIDIIPLPEAEFTTQPNGVSCFGSPVVFTNASSTSVGTITQYQWDFGNSDTSTDQNTEYTFGSVGIHQVDLIVANSYGCVSETYTGEVLVNTLPVPGFTLPDAVCEWEEFKPVNITTYVNYQEYSASPDVESVIDMEWVFGNGSSTEFEPTHFYSAEGTKIIKLIATHAGPSPTGCKDSTTLTLDVNPRPKPSFTFEDAGTVFDGLGDGVCEGVKIDFVNGTTITNTENLSYIWHFDDDSTSTILNPRGHFSVDGVRTLDIE